jgi:hypothetical protein
MLKEYFQLGLALARLTRHASHEARRRIYRLSWRPLDTAAILDVLEHDQGTSVTPPAPMYGDCPICDAALDNYRGHRLLCPEKKSECSGCGAVRDETCVCPPSPPSDFALSSSDVSDLLVRPDAAERARLLAFCRRGFAALNEDES